MDGRSSDRDDPVVVTGVGALTALGDSLHALSEAAFEGRSGVARISRFDVSECPIRIAAEIKPELPSSARLRRQVDRATVIGMTAGRCAMEDAGLDTAMSERGMLLVGTGIGGVSAFEEQTLRFHEGGGRALSPYAIPMVMPNATAAQLSIALAWCGPSLTVTNACAASATAIGEATAMVSSGRCEWALAGGVEAAITPLMLDGFHRMGALSPWSGAPASACRPFDAHRNGFVLGEGAAFVVLEHLSRARARGARVYGAVAGYGATSDAFHIAAPDPDGAAAARAMEEALRSAAVDASAIGHVNAHGTGTTLNDISESRAIARVFGDRGVPVTSTKPVTGHLLGAAGAVEVAITLAALQEGVIPPTMNYETPDADLAVRVVAGAAVESPARYAMSNSFAFGGHNVSLVLERCA